MRTLKATRRRPIAMLVALVLVAAACSDDATVSTATDGEADASVPVSGGRSGAAPSTAPPAVSSAPSPSTLPTPGTPTPTTGLPATSVPADTPFPAGALPILRTFEFAQPVTTPIGFDDEIVVSHGMGIARLDVDTGEIVTTTLAAPDELKAEVFYAVSDGSSYVAVLDVIGQGTLDTTVSIDPDTLRRTGRTAHAPYANFPMFATGPGTRSMLTRTPDGVLPFDPASLQTGERFLPFSADFRGHTDRGELWSWTSGGTVRVFDESAEKIATLELDEQLSPSSGAVMVTESSFWLGDDTPQTLMRIDRRTKQRTHDVSVLDFVEGADAVQLRWSDREAPFVTANVVVGDEGWWMLFGIDPDTGALVSSHVISTDAFEYGWNAFDAPAVATVADRLFVLDHRRRIVEVDVAALAEPSTVPWADPGLGREPVLDEAESVIADLTLRFLAGEEVGFTDPDRAAATFDALLRPGVDAWDVYGVGVDGDRAWSRAGPIGEGVGAFFVFERTDSGWLVSADGLCALAVGSPDPCT